ncbi:MAG: hypothetical protein MJZ81_00260 [Bacteroidales bacterium]|nr:hypothetical protein [Bacteroidales bacterium]
MRGKCRRLLRGCQPVPGRDGNVYINQQNNEPVCFVEEDCRKRDRRNTRIFSGQYIAAAFRARDGPVRLNFREIRPRREERKPACPQEPCREVC